MLRLKDITKSYTTGDFTQQALAGVSLEFRESEFVAVLGPSGSGKTTLLNIVGGLDRYDSGDLILNGRSTKTFKATDWDAYRNNSVGFIFQSYNLIGHISVLKNVEMGMTLSGVSAAERKRRAMGALERVGIAEHAKKKPNQLSGGQAQRVAIARALANDPDIILADEPTGALDSETSVQIMNLIREIAKDKLVIMVTHNGELAEEYATRIIKLKDGKVVDDSDPVEEEAQGSGYNLKKTAMHFFTALKLSLSNIMTKKGRTILTAFASSIGIIGIGLILSLSNGFNIKVEEFEAGTLSEYPILISQQAMDMSMEDMQEMQGEMMDNMSGITGEEREQPSAPELYPYDSILNTISHKNEISDEYTDYLESVDPALVSSISYTLGTGFNLAVETESGAKLVSGNSVNFSGLPRNLSEEGGIFEDNYDILAGSAPREMTDLLLVVDTKNRVSKTVLDALGLDSSAESIPFEDIVGMELKLVPNDDYYIELKEMPGMFTVNLDTQALYDSENALTLRICGVTRLQADSAMTILSDGLAYLPELADHVIADSENSAVVKAQRDAAYNILTGEAFDLNTQEGQDARDQLLSYLGDGKKPYVVMIFPKDFSSKEQVLEYLDAWNAGKEDEETVVYTDMAAMITELSGSIMDAITIVLVAFSAISLVVSVIMIAIITYISVIERTKEIGVLRALGARKKDITRVFNAETTIIGLVSGVLGISIAYLLTIPASAIIENLSGLPGVALFNPLHALLLVVISLALTVLGGFIPAKMASRRDPVVALRAE